jgi:hypothetical protein
MFQQEIPSTCNPARRREIASSRGDCVEIAGVVTDITFFPRINPPR